MTFEVIKFIFSIRPFQASLAEATPERPQPRFGRMRREKTIDVEQRERAYREMQEEGTPEKQKKSHSRASVIAARVLKVAGGVHSKIEAI